MHTLTHVRLGGRRRAVGPVRARRGAAAMEFAFTLPIMVMLLLGSIEFGNYFTQLAVVKAATRDAARFGSNQPSLALAQTQAAAAVRTLLVDMDYPCGSGNVCTVDARIVQEGGINFVRVDVDVPYDQITGAIPNWFGEDGNTTVKTPTRLRSASLFPIVGP